MDTKVIIGVVAAIVVVGGGAWYLSSNAPEGAEQLKSDADTEVEAAGSGTFAEFVGRAGSWKCDVSVSVEDAPSEGAAYISNGKVRADFTSTINGKTVTSHMIHADGYVYTWSDAFAQGMKMRIPEGEATSNTTAGVRYDSQVDYDCDPWMADVSLFMAPSAVTFMELGAGMPGYPQ